MLLLLDVKVVTMAFVAVAAVVDLFHPERIFLSIGLEGLRRMLRTDPAANALRKRRDGRSRSRRKGLREHDGLAHLDVEVQL